ncbi:hypothetical protein SAMN05720759_1151, partial [Fibrobacter sp. UWB12]
PIENMFAQTEQYLRELMGIPEDYDIVFLGGGCSLLFCMLPTSASVLRRTRIILVISYTLSVG